MELKLIECDKKYWLDILNIRNNDNEGFINQQKISDENHFAYMEKYNKNYRVCLMQNVFVGFIGIVDDDIRLAVKKEYKQLGIGKFMINEFNKIFEIKTAKIKIDNIASQKLFESCGFKKKLYIYQKNET